MLKSRESRLRERHLKAYLHHHLGRAAAATALARRVLNENLGSAYESNLAPLCDDFDFDLEQLRCVLSALAFLEHAPFDEGVGWLSGKVAHLGIRSRLIGDSSLTRLVEFEEMILATSSKVHLWRTLLALKEHESSISGFDFPGLMERARDQERRLVELHGLAEAGCFPGSDSEEIFQLLERDHTEIAALLERAIATPTSNERSPLTEQLRVDVLAHFKAEELTLYDALLAHSGTHDLVEPGREDHELIKTRLRQVLSDRSGADESRAKLQRLRDVFQRHVAREENEVFGRARRVLVDDSASRLGDRFVELKEEERNRLVSSENAP